VLEQSYDPKAHAYYLAVKDGTVTRTVEVSPAVLVDLDAQGVAVGIEILGPFEFAHAAVGEALARFEFSAEARNLLGTLAGWPGVTVPTTAKTSHDVLTPA